MNCSCGNNVSFEKCCEPLLLGKAHATCAEQLMRSRYSAYVHHKIDYLIDTTYPTKRKLHLKREIEKWAKESKWLKLEILFANENIVEFEAIYQDKAGKVQVHHEKSKFIFEGKRWYFD